MPKWLSKTLLVLGVLLLAVVGGWLALQPWTPAVREIEGSTLVSLGALGVAVLALVTSRQERRAALRAELFRRRFDVYHDFVKAAELLRTRYFGLHRPLPERDGADLKLPKWLNYPARGTEEWWRENRETHQWLLEFQQSLEPLMMVFPKEQVHAAGQVCTAAAFWRECILGEEGRGDEYSDPSSWGLFQFGNALFDFENSMRAFNGLSELTDEIARLVNARAPSERKMYTDPFAERRKKWQESQKELGMPPSAR